MVPLIGIYMRHNTYWEIHFLFSLICHVADNNCKRVCELNRSKSTTEFGVLSTRSNNFCFVCQQNHVVTINHLTVFCCETMVFISLIVSEILDYWLKIGDLFINTSIFRHYHKLQS